MPLPNVHPVLARVAAGAGRRLPRGPEGNGPAAGRRSRARGRRLAASRRFFRRSPAACDPTVIIGALVSRDSGGDDGSLAHTGGTDGTVPDSGRDGAPFDADASDAGVCPDSGRADGAVPDSGRVGGRAVDDELRGGILRVRGADGVLLRDRRGLVRARDLPGALRAACGGFLRAGHPRRRRIAGSLRAAGRLPRRRLLRRLVLRARVGSEQRGLEPLSLPGWRGRSDAARPVGRVARQRG